MEDRDSYNNRAASRFASSARSTICLIAASISGVGYGARRFRIRFQRVLVRLAPEDDNRISARISGDRRIIWRMTGSKPARAVNTVYSLDTTQPSRFFGTTAILP